MATLLEVIEAVGERHVAVQYVNKAMVNVRLSGRGKNQYTQLTIATEEVTPSDFVSKPSKVGLILWIDTERYENALASIEADKKD